MKVWISAAVAAKLLDVNKGSMPKIAEASGIRRQVIPGFEREKVRYSAEDVERVAREAIIEPGQQARAVAS